MGHRHLRPGQPLKLGMLNYRPVPQVKQREEGIIEGSEPFLATTLSWWAMKRPGTPCKPGLSLWAGYRSIPI